MARPCTVCQHEDRHDIDRALLAGWPNTKLSSEFAVTEQALRRHAANHLPAALVKAQEIEEITDADSLKTELEGVKADVARLKDKAEIDGDYRTALMGCDRALKALELQAKLLQLIDERPQVNVLVSAEWVQIRTAIIDALRPYPEAKRDVLAAVKGAGDNADA